MTAIKFCGFTHADDLRVAINLGVDAVGLVFYEPSPRYVSPKRACELLQSVPPFVTVVALVVNMSGAGLVDLANQVAFDVLQFHGDETADDCQRLAGLVGKRWIKALRIDENHSQQTIMHALYCYKTAGASAVLLDAYHPAAFGGTGICFDWAKIPKQSPVPIILAGGLTADNVGQAIVQTPVYGVDVSGGIEWQKGRKCAQKMQMFVKKVQCLP